MGTPKNDIWCGGNNYKKSSVKLILLVEVLSLLKTVIDPQLGEQVLCEQVCMYVDVLPPVRAV